MALFSLVSNLTYTVPNLSLQIERMYLRYEQINEFNQPWKYIRECSVAQRVQAWLVVLFLLHVQCGLTALLDYSCVAIFAIQNAGEP